MLHPLLVQVQRQCLADWLRRASKAGKVRQPDGVHVATKLKPEDSVQIYKSHEQVCGSIAVQCQYEHME